ncbi:hypothetical protein Osc7112_6065 [Oscillatoria nigro-viridis PCC 7112]|uniref:Uncharacterized protein n=1 Tax=Phormidium nigroviride PCC 7112 TaxID=179408 RepID=K9VQN5_9CYAN|nr:hypothetical protein [Oscillatoria nigro-viridis]AFZ10256.1 hypothetical protein Osc7112_6065 [Oscillatoria nigro-viridis PCC 7112]
MIISDLNYLETAETSAVVGGIFFGQLDSDVDAKLNVKERFDVQKIYKQYVDVKGNLATAQSEAFGKNTSTQIFTTVVEGKYSASTGFSAAS